MTVQLELTKETNLNLTTFTAPGFSNATTGGTGNINMTGMLILNSTGQHDSDLHPVALVASHIRQGIVQLGDLSDLDPSDSDYDESDFDSPGGSNTETHTLEEEQDAVVEDEYLDAVTGEVAPVQKRGAAAREPRGAPAAASQEVTTAAVGIPPLSGMSSTATTTDPPTVTPVRPAVPFRDIIVERSANGTTATLHEVLRPFAHLLWNQKVDARGGAIPQDFRAPGTPQYIRSHTTAYVRQHSPHFASRVNDTFHFLGGLVFELYSEIAWLDRKYPDNSDLTQPFLKRMLGKRLPAIALKGEPLPLMYQMVRPLKRSIEQREASRKQAFEAALQREQIVNWRTLLIKGFYGFESVRTDYDTTKTSIISPDEFLSYITGPDAGHDFQYISPAPLHEPSTLLTDQGAIDYRVSGNNGDHIFLVRQEDGQSRRWYFRRWDCQEYTMDDGVTWHQNPRATPYPEEWQARRENLNSFRSRARGINNRAQLHDERNFPQRLQPP